MTTTTSLPVPRVVALVAARDRADTVGATVAALARLAAVHEVVVVDDGSTDTTASVAVSAGARVVRLAANRGKGGAVGAGVAVSPDADVYLLIDADVGATAAAAAGLLRPVLGGDADMAVGVLPGAGGRGGFGLVRRLAGVGIARASGFAPRAPLSGQRAVRASLLRTLELAPRFGLETALTIDALAAGARVVEVDVALDHRHTGRSLGGFAHRAGQGRDIVRALWPRLTSSRFRVALVVATLVIALAAALWSGGRWEPTSVAARGSAAKVVVIGAPGLTFDELVGGTVPHVSALADAGALGALSVRTASAHPSVAEGWATLGAGSRVEAVAATDDAVDTPTGPLVRGALATRRANQDRHLPTLPGALGDALHAAGRRTAVVGTAGGDTPSAPAAAAVMDGKGAVDAGTVRAPDLLVADTAAPFAVRADPEAVIRHTRQALARADVVVVDPGDLERAAAGTVEQRQLALASTDDLVGRLTANLAPATLVLVVSVVPPTPEWRLTPVVASGAGVVPGWLHSPSTKRLGLVTLTDLAPMILDAVGAAVPPAMIGHALRYHPGPVDRSRLTGLDRESSWRERIYYPVALSYIAAQALAYLLVMAVLSRRRAVGKRFAPAAAAGGASGGATIADRWGPALRRIVVAIAAFPLATFLLRAVPGAPTLGPGGAVAVLVALDLGITGIALRARRHPLAPLAWVMGATAWLLVTDVATGARLQVAAIMGYSPHTAARFFGLGNSAFAILAATAILGAATHLAHAPRRQEALAAVAAFLVLVAVVDGAPGLGNDVGGILTLVPVFGLTLLVLSGRRLSWRAVALAVVAAVFVVAVAAGVDLLRPPEARTHLGRMVAETWHHGNASLVTTIARKTDTNLRILRSSVWTWTVPIIAVFMLYLLAWRRMGATLLPRGSAVRTGVVSALVAGLLGFAVNDSGVIVTALVLTYVGPYLTLLALAGEQPPAPVVVLAPGPRPPVPATAP